MNDKELLKDLNKNLSEINETLNKFLEFQVNLAVDKKYEEIMFKRSNTSAVMKAMEKVPTKEEIRKNLLSQE